MLSAYQIAGVLSSEGCKTHRNNETSCSSMAEQPADNRQTADRYRAGGPAMETDMMDLHKRGVLWTPSVQPIGSAVDF